MTRIKVFRTNKGLAVILNIIGGLLVLVAIGIFIKNLFFDDEAGLRLWDFLPLFLEGILLIVLANFNLRSGRYYIEWDDRMIKFFLPKHKQVQSMKISDIKGINIGLFEIQITASDEVRILDLENVQFEEIKAIKHKFVELSRSLTGD